MSTTMDFDLNDVRVFAQVVEAGSFTAAGTKLGLPTSTVSRRVARLEKGLGVRLLQRTTRKLSLTEAGQLYFERSVHALSGLDEAQKILSQGQATPKGRVRLSAPVEYRATMSVMNSFLKKFPEVRVEIDFSSHHKKPLTDGYDVAIVPGAPTDLSAVAHKLLDSPFCIVASSAYLKRRGEPKHVSDLLDHDCIIFGSSTTSAHWQLFARSELKKVSVRGRLAANHVLAIRDAALAGQGLALIPKLSCATEISKGRLRVVLPQAAPPAVPIYLTYPADRYLSAGVRAVVEHLKANFCLKERSDTDIGPTKRVSAKRR